MEPAQSPQKQATEIVNHSASSFTNSAISTVCSLRKVTFRLLWIWPTPRAFAVRSSLLPSPLPAHAVQKACGQPPSPRMGVVVVLDPLCPLCPLGYLQFVDKGSVIWLETVNLLGRIRGSWEPPGPPSWNPRDPLMCCPLFFFLLLLLPFLSLLVFSCFSSPSPPHPSCCCLPVMSFQSEIQSPSSHRAITKAKYDFSIRQTTNPDLASFITE